ELVRALSQKPPGRSAGATGQGAGSMDIRRIMRLLPHRYPFLMIDRVLEVEGNQRAVAIKNVTINEPFFQGHYPDQPIMPGVMIVEALAQLSGILLGEHLERTGKVAMLLSIDRVKMRRPVRPGDQLILEARTIRVRDTIGHCRCRALVDGEVATEAEIKFILADADKV
ncbi:MAG: 3-hydroxyacyl-ACP dehydratase FabZ, partial [Phycisphaerae bacterium]|nr:3-hydroxyacyl-ACP dehydratase FabZ [Phycisphaerae bacterium]